LGSLKHYWPFRFAGCIPYEQQLDEKTPRKLDPKPSSSVRIWAALAVSLLASGLDRSVASAQNAPSTGVSAQEAFQKGAEAYSKNDYPTALKWFQSAADRGVAGALFSIGVMYRDAKGVNPDHTAAMKSFQAAADKGYVRAKTAIGRQFLLGNGVPQDNAMAMTWFLKAAEQEEIEAQARLAVMYTNGTGVKPDLAAAVAWYLRAINPANEAQQDLPAPVIKQMKAAYEFAIGTIYEDGGPGVSMDTTMAKDWYRKASDHGNAQAKARLAELDLPSSARADPITLLCEGPLPNGNTQKSLVQIDTRSKYVRVDTFTQGILEYRDGTFGKIIKSGLMLDQAANVHQFVVIENNQVKFGVKDKEGSENTINLRTGVFTISGRGNGTAVCSRQSAR
jgi:TPR repeat protein